MLIGYNHLTAIYDAMENITSYSMHNYFWFTYWCNKGSSAVHPGSWFTNQMHPVVIHGSIAWLVDVTFCKWSPYNLALCKHQGPVSISEKTSFRKIS